MRQRVIRKFLKFIIHHAIETVAIVTCAKCHTKHMKRDKGRYSPPDLSCATCRDCFCRQSIARRNTDPVQYPAASQGHWLNGSEHLVVIIQYPIMTETGRQIHLGTASSVGLASHQRLGSEVSSGKITNDS